MAYSARKTRATAVELSSYPARFHGAWLVCVDTFGITALPEKISAPTTEGGYA